MNISYNWLKRYIATDLPAEKIAEILTDIGLEVEGFEKIETVKGGLRGVVVGEVVTCADHPDSDHLHVTAVDVGAAEPLQIVCGAANCRAGLKVLCATVGAVLYPDGGDEEFKIKRSKIRGVESLGMLCAEDELGIGSSHDGIMELPADAPVGMEAREYLHVEDDYLIEIGLTPNRVDAASHIGVARDLAAYLKSRGENAEVKLPDVSAFAPDNHDLEVAVRVENPEAAPRYAGVTVTGCKIGPSPEWMQNCLRAAGINPKNNLVDITNFVLFELGQPLHAFDLAKIEGREVVVRTCAEGTPFVTLDGVERKYVEEGGGMNVMFKINGTVVTPALTGSILRGVTRKSAIELLKSWGVPVEERLLSVDELFDAAASGALEEAWCIGTAAVISPIGELSWGDRDYKVNDNKIGALSQKLYDELTGIQWGTKPDPFGWVCPID